MAQRGYVTLLSSYYILIPVLLQYSTAVVMNLSLLTSDFWSILAGIMLFNVKLNYFYFIAMFCVITGVTSYNLISYFERKEKEKEKESSNVQSE